MKLNKEVIENDDHELRSLIIAILKRKRGFRIHLGGLSVGESGRDYSVVLDQEYLFDNVKKAVDFFLAMRRRNKLGKDTVLEAEDAELHFHFDG